LTEEIDLTVELEALVDGITAGVNQGEINIGVGLIATTLAHVACQMEALMHRVEDTNEALSEILELVSDILETKDGCTKVERETSHA